MSKVNLSTISNQQGTRTVDVEDLIDNQQRIHVNNREVIRRLAAEAGLTLVAGSFEEGASVNLKTEVIWQQATGKIFGWFQDAAKTVGAGSTPETTGGIGAGAWVDRAYDTFKSVLSRIGGYSLLESGGKQIAPMSHITLSRMPGGGTYADLIDAVNGGYESIEVDTNIIRTSTITIPYTLKRIFGRGSIDTGGNRVFQANSTVLYTKTVTSITTTPDSTDAAYLNQGCRITVSDVTGLVAGQIGYVTGSANQTFWFKIRFLSGNDVYTDKPLRFTVGSSATLNIIRPFDCKIEGVEFKGSGVTASAIGVIKSAGIKLRDLRVSSAINLYSSSGAFNSVFGTEANNANSLIVTSDSGPEDYLHNKSTGQAIGIRLVRSHGCRAHYNDIVDGSDQIYGIGIELTGESNSNDKNCNHSIMFNKALSSTHGRAGSGIGGIHLNFNAKFNDVMHNDCMFNTFGIYLENTASYNRILHNNCSYNDGYYGTGIELDADCSYNEIEYNTCDYNVGSTTGNESTGILLRNGPTKLIPEIDNLPHSNNYNTIRFNKCRNNGRDGIRANGLGNVVESNSLSGNGSGTTRFASRADIYCDDAAALTVARNSINSVGSGTLYSMLLTGVAGLVCNDNPEIKAGGGQLRAVLIQHSSLVNLSGVQFKRNKVTSAVTQTAVTVAGASGNLASVVDVVDNEINHVSNGNPCLSVSYVNNYTVHSNRYTGTGTTETIGTGSTNRKGPVATQSASVATDVATIVSDFNGLLTKLKSSGIMSA